MARNDEDKEMIRLLEKLPQIEDSRSMEEVYRSLRAPKKKGKIWTVAVPAFSLLAAASLFIIMFFSQPPDAGQEMAMDRGAAKRAMPEETAKETPDAAMNTKMHGENEERKEDQEGGKADSRTVIQEPEATAVYPGEEASGRLVTLGVVTNDALVLPVGMIVPDVKESRIEAYRTAAGNIASHYPQFADPSPLLETLKLEDGESTAEVVIDPEHLDYFTRSEKHIMEMLKYMLAGQGVEKVEFRDEEGNPAELGEYGIIPDLEIKNAGQKAFYSYSPAGSEESYLIPADLPSGSLQEAVQAMKEAPNDLYGPVLPKDTDVNVQVEKDMAVLHFEQELDLAEKGEKTGMRMIEGLLLTAREFGCRQVKFDNVKPEKWGPFNFGMPVDVPDAPNRLAYR